MEFQHKSNNHSILTDSDICVKTNCIWLIRKIFGNCMTERKNPNILQTNVRPNFQFRISYFIPTFFANFSFPFSSCVRRQGNERLSLPKHSWLTKFSPQQNPPKMPFTLDVQEGLKERDRERERDESKMFVFQMKSSTRYLYARASLPRAFTDIKIRKEAIA